MVEGEVLVIQDDRGIVYPSTAEDFWEHRKETAERESEVIRKLLNQEVVTVFHHMRSAEDFESIQNMGVRSNYKVRTAGGVWNLIYFSLLHPSKDDGKNIAITLNKDTRKMLIYDNRDAKSIGAQDLIERGYDGAVEQAGVGPEKGQKYMLRLFDGANLRDQVIKLSELDAN